MKNALSNALDKIKLGAIATVATVALVGFLFATPIFLIGVIFGAIIMVCINMDDEDDEDDKIVPRHDT